MRRIFRLTDARPDARRDVNDEIRFHLDMRAQELIEQGVPAARQSLHMSGKAADVRIAGLTEEVLGGLVKSFRKGGVGFYYRSGPKGGWIHTDTGLNRTWKG